MFTSINWCASSHIRMKDPQRTFVFFFLSILARIEMTCTHATKQYRSASLNKEKMFFFFEKSEKKCTHTLRNYRRWNCGEHTNKYDMFCVVGKQKCFFLFLCHVLQPHNKPAPAYLIDLIFFSNMYCKIHFPLPLTPPSQPLTTNTVTTFIADAHVHELLIYLLKLEREKPSISRMHWKFNELALNELIGQYGAFVNIRCIQRPNTM